MRFLLLLVLLCSVGHAQTDYWINPNSGSDFAAGTSPSTPLRTISRGLQLSGPGTTIFLERGEYSMASGEAQVHIIDADVTIESLHGPEETTLLSVSDSTFISMDSGSTLEGVTVRVPDTVLVVLVTDSSALSTRASLRNCHFLGGGTALYDANVNAESCRFDGQYSTGVYVITAETTLIDCEFVGAPGQHGLYVTLWARVEARRCKFHGYDRAGILMSSFHSSSSPLLILKDSLVVNNPGAGLEVRFPSSDPISFEVDVQGTTFTGNGEHGIFQAASSFTPGLTLRSSIVADNGLGDFYGTGTAEHSLISDGSGPSSTTNLTGDPGFVNAAAGDWSLRFDSPCLDRGDPASVGLDFLGHSRSVDSDLDLAARADMGAFEHRPLVGPAHATVGQPFELGVTGPSGGFSTIIVAPLGYAPSGATTPFGRLFLNPQGAFRIAPAPTTGAGPTFVDLATTLDPAWIGTTIGLQALPRSTSAPAGGAYSNPLLVSIE